jgi:hypothetical protein
MIDKVRTIWIKGFLEKSLFNEVRILLGLAERSSAIASPFHLLVMRPDEGDRPLPPGTRVLDFYDDSNRSLLILGAPGSGKTTLLLELARDLLNCAARDAAHPIPVVFPLSTWGRAKKPLADWLQDELNIRYDVPCAIATQWISTDQLLPLLDGLDEVKGVDRAQCVEAINGFRRSHGFLPLVVTSRAADYEALPCRLRLHGGLLVQPLTSEQVDSYLSDLGRSGERVRQALSDEPSLWELLDSPLLLTVVTMAYAGRSAQTPRISGADVGPRERLLDLYVNQMLGRRAADLPYGRETTFRWLSWLAKQLITQSQTVFYLDRIQLDWLPENRRDRSWLRYTLMLLLTLVGLPISALIGFLFMGLVLGPRAGTAIGLVMGVLAMLVALITKSPRSVEAKIRSAGVYFSLAQLRRVQLAFEIGSLAQRPLALLVAGLVPGIIAGLYGWASRGAFGAPVFALEVCLLAGLIVGLSALRSAMLASGVLHEQIRRPNEGVRRLARNALLVGLLTAMVSGLSIGFVIGLCTRILIGWLVGVALGFWSGTFVGLLFGLMVALEAGGDMCFYHVFFRFWLVVHGSMPSRYVRFLDYAADRILLRRVGGGYIFIHRMLMEWFAARYVEPSDKTAKPEKPLSLNNDA